MARGHAKFHLIKKLNRREGSSVIDFRYYLRINFGRYHRTIFAKPIAPRLVCEQIKSTTKTSDCGTGGELGFSSTSEDGLSSADMRVLLDRINGGKRSSFVFSVEHQF